MTPDTEDDYKRFMYMSKYAWSDALTRILNEEKVRFTKVMIKSGCSNSMITDVVRLPRRLVNRLRKEIAEKKD